MKQNDNLSRALQPDTPTSAAQGSRMARDVMGALSKDRNDASFDLCWERILQRKTTEVENTEDPKLPRKRKAPMRQKIRVHSSNLLSLLCCNRYHSSTHQIALKVTKNR